MMEWMDIYYFRLSNDTLGIVIIRSFPMIRYLIRNRSKIYKKWFDSKSASFTFRILLPYNSSWNSTQNLGAAEFSYGSRFKNF